MLKLMATEETLRQHSNQFFYCGSNERISERNKQICSFLSRVAEKTHKPQKCQTV